MVKQSNWSFRLMIFNKQLVHPFGVFPARLDRTPCNHRWKSCLYAGCISGIFHRDTLTVTRTASTHVDYRPWAGAEMDWRSWVNDVAHVRRCALPDRPAQAAWSLLLDDIRYTHCNSHWWRRWTTLCRTGRPPLAMAGCLVRVQVFDSRGRASLNYRIVGGRESVYTCHGRERLLCTKAQTGYLGAKVGLYLALFGGSRSGKQVPASNLQERAGAPLPHMQLQRGTPDSQ